MCLLVLALLSMIARAAQPASGTALLQPTSVAYDSAGDLFFAESRNHVVRRVDTSGQLTTVAGSAVQGFAGDGGPATAAELDSPRGVALDGAGNLYIADTHNNRVRRVDAATQQITTIAGTGGAGYGGDGGQATAATLRAPLALALDAANHLYVADSGNQRVRAIDLATGVITTVAGNGQQGFSGDNGAAVDASLDTPSGVAVDGFGNLFFSDTGNHRVREVSSATRKVVTLASDGTSGMRLRRPEGISLDVNGGLLISDAGTHSVYLFNLANGRLSLVAGTGVQAFEGDAGLATLAMLDSPVGVAAGPAGSVVVADTNNGRLRLVTAESGGTIQTIAGLGGLLPGTLVLQGASSQSYGTATMSAVFQSLTPGSGKVSLIETSGAGSQVLATSTLSGGSAVFDLSALPAGTYSLETLYSGDGTHAPVESAPETLTIAPLGVTATLSGTQLVYGQALTSVAASLAGVVPRDQGSVGVNVAVAGATFPMPPGSYPLALTLNGTAAGNYTLAAASGALTVVQAPVLVSVAHDTSGFSIAVASSTVGRPTGAVSLVTSAGSVLASVPLSAGSATAISDSSLTAGTYDITAVYSGDVDFLPGRSAVVAATVGSSRGAPAPADFSLTSTGSSAVTMDPGGTASYAFSVQTTGGALNGPITLAVTGTPALSSATFTPSLITPGTTAASVTLNVVLPRAAASLRTPGGVGTGPVASGAVGLAAMLPLLLVRGRRRRGGWGALAGLLCLLLVVSGCGNRVVSTSSVGTAAKFTMLVTGTTTRADGSTLQHSATVTLAVP